MARSGRPTTSSYGNLAVIQTLPQTVPVVIRSKKIVDTGGTAGANRWFNLDGALNQHNLLTATGLAISATTPGTPTGYDNHNFSYDPEGQTWLGGVHPTWFPAEVGQAWGIQYLYVNWGDGSALERYDYVPDLWGLRSRRDGPDPHVHRHRGWDGADDHDDGRGLHGLRVGGVLAHGDAEDGPGRRQRPLVAASERRAEEEGR